MRIEYHVLVYHRPTPHQTVQTNVHTFYLSTQPGQRYPNISIQCLEMFVIIIYNACEIFNDDVVIIHSYI